ncbi:MAG: metallophosphoesterase [Simkaniaceae bacterium]|jgi:predicted phosphohydrolase|nr:MAG: metallophosphoesterase [Simkaniaceae bacterium]
MKIWAIADLHLCFGAPDKSMEVFGPAWENYVARIEENWKKIIRPEDLVLLAGDITWAMKLEEAMKDLNWIDALPGTKVILKGNHDYWWPSNKKLVEALPPSIHFVNNSAYTIGDITIGGSRLWDTSEYSFSEYITFVESPLVKEKKIDEREVERIYNRELERLRVSLQQLDSKASYRIAMTHYPPIGADLKETRASKILEEFGINVCVFGHLHNVKKERPLFGEKNQIIYLFTSADYLGFEPILVRG